MKTLIIHPKDRSTTFLEKTYENIPDDQKTVLTGGVSQDKIIELIKEHDRIMMMGHGCPSGLFNTYDSKFLKFGVDPESEDFNEHIMKNYCGLVINHQMVKHLKEKECVFIWCNADMFVEQFPELKGFYTGMFISEVGESFAMGVPSPQSEVDESNYGFVEIFGKYVNEPCSVIHENVLKDYGEMTEKNRVAKYNHERLYLINE